MVRKRKSSQYHKFEKLKNKKKKKPRYASLRTEDTINPEKVMNKVWSRLGKTLDQRMIHDVYKIIDEFLLEKLYYDSCFTLEGFGTLEVIKDYSNKKKLVIKFTPDLKLKEKIKLLQKDI